MSKIMTRTERMKACFFSVMLFGLCAHAMGLLNLNINHDSLNEYYLSVATPVKLAAGRYLMPVLKYIMGEYITLTWVSGLVSLLAIGTSVYLMSEMFSIDTFWQNILLAGICTTNITITATIASYIHDCVGDCLALLLAVYSAFLWTKINKKFSWKYTTVGIVILTASLGLYQAYFSVTLTLICIYSIRELLKGVSAKNVILSTLRALPMLILAVSVYVVCFVCISKVFGVELRTEGVGGLIEKGLPNILSIAKAVILGYGLVVANFLLPNIANAQSVFEPIAMIIGVLNTVLLCRCTLVLTAHFRMSKIRGAERFLVLAFITMLPMCMTIIMAASGVYHELLRYSFYLIYLFVLIVLDFEPRSNKIKDFTRLTTIGIIGFVIFNNIQLANMAYTQKAFQRQATLSAMTRIVYSLEQYEPYEYGKSKVLISGSVFSDDAGWANDVLYVVSGMEYKNQITMPQGMQTYFELILQYPLELCSDEEAAIIYASKEYKEMPCYPQKGCILEINGVIVVKCEDCVFQQGFGKSFENDF